MNACTDCLAIATEEADAIFADTGEAIGAEALAGGACTHDLAAGTKVTVTMRTGKTRNGTILDRYPSGLYQIAIGKHSWTVVDASELTVRA